MFITKINDDINNIYDDQIVLNGSININIDEDQYVINEKINNSIPILDMRSANPVFTQNNSHLMLNLNNQRNCILKKKKSPFTIEEDQYLIYLVNIFGQEKWSKIADGMTKANFPRNGRQCRDRYCHYLDPNLKTDANWSSEEDKCLINCVNELGNKWKLFEQKFSGRTEVSLRNRYNLLIRKFNRDQKSMFKKTKKLFKLYLNFSNF